MAANDYIRTVNITPLSTSYSWDTPPSWITINRIGTSDDWTITIAANSGIARNATLTVRHANTTTVDTINVSQSAGIVVPTATPIVPTATPIPPTPTPTSPAGAGYSLSFVDSSFTIDDYTFGGNTYVDLNYNITGATTPPTLVQKSVYLDWTNRSGPTGGVGTIRLYSLLPPAELPVSMQMLPIFTLAHPLDSGVTASIPGYIIQAQDELIIRNPDPTSVPSPTTPPSTGGGGGGGGCLIGGTKITLSDGSLINIENLNVGQKLMATVFGNMPNTDDVTTLKSWTEINPSISSTESELVSIKAYEVSKTYNFNNGLIVSSGDHLHIVKVNDSTWTVLEAENIKIGDKFMTIKGEVLIGTITEDHNITTVYKLDVEPNDTYIANGVVTHNLKDETLNPVEDVRQQ
jgi:hypothetical protein